MFVLIIILRFSAKIISKIRSYLDDLGYLEVETPILQPIYGGANNGTLTGLGTADQRRALYLKLFSGEMFKGFQHNTIARDLVQKRTLTSGKSMQFIYTG